jgi:ribosomal protein S12 methylthiotransferase
MLNEKTAGIISLGCSKNFVDSEYILGILREAGYKIVPDEKAEIVIINTCGFIKDAVEESHEVIREIIERKQNGLCKKLIVAGCLPLRDYKTLSQKFPEIDSIVGSFNIKEIPEIIKVDKKISVCGDVKINESMTPRLLTRLHSGRNGQANSLTYSYIKISEGCSNNCTYCTIPSIKGSLQSRTIASILKEAKMLVENGALEVNLISQDTTGFGMDKNHHHDLEKLLKNLEKIEGLKWIRLLYCHPANFSEKLIKCIRDSEKICKYIDLPLQHINDRILQKMGRRVSRKYIEELLNKLRKEIPSITLRTTFIVGFPGESDREFRELYDFVKDFEFEHMGAFKYSREQGTPAANFEGQVSEKVKTERYDALMRLQAEISFKKNQELIGKYQDMLVEMYNPEEDALYGRISSQAPEVDGNTILYGTSTGSNFLKTRIVDADHYDLIGELKGE